MRKGRGYVLITVIFLLLSLVAYYKLMDIDVGKFAIFEMVGMIGFYFSIVIYMYTRPFAPHFYQLISE